MKKTRKERNNDKLEYAEKEPIVIVSCLLNKQRGRGVPSGVPSPSFSFIFAFRFYVHKILCQLRSIE
ncbi:hypothetical protein RIF29_42511 [Crotalaria pallida]|uniref:Uncharacterized protein n=1 Tax=Crotalaria pallida TaxID=3830 RepID=A0AAN9E721_CROPI